MNTKLPENMKAFLAPETASADARRGFDAPGAEMTTVKKLLVALGVAAGAVLAFMAATSLMGGSSRNCIVGAGGGYFGADNPPSCSDCDAEMKRTVFQNGKTFACAGVRSAGGGRCVLRCE